jgi:type I restriction enzyme, S subunit
VANCSDLVVIRPGPQLDARFLVYYLNSLAQHHIDSYAVGAVQQHFNIRSTKAMTIPLPPLGEQRAIARILGSLDDKIELNRPMCRTLEELAAAIFKSWFVDFDPVIARAEGRQPFGMDAETAALFPDAFDESEVGPVPAGWRVGAVPGLNRELAYLLAVLVPAAQVVNAFCRNVRPMRLLQALNEGELRTLAAIRDPLLPKLMSGEIRVG